MNLSLSDSPNKVLIVDDTPANLEVLYKTLKEENYELSVAKDGANALNCVPKFRPHLILLDIMMPVMDGFETCQKLKDNETTKDIPIIFLTAKSEKKDVLKGFDLGAVDYITKPFNHEEVLARVKNQLKVNSLRENNKRVLRELERLNQDIQALSVIASQDLKEELKKVKYLGEYLKREYKSGLDDEGQSYLDDIEMIANQLSYLTDSFLDYTRIIKEAKNFKPINLSNLAEQTLDSLENLIKKTKGTVNLCELPTITAEPFLMRRLFQSLISNGLTYHRSAEPPVVDVHSRQTSAGFWEIAIIDNGVGFDRKYIENVFNSFERAEVRQSFEGIGMGLAICKKIVDYHGGTITAQNRPTHGTAIVITIPENQQ